MADPTREPPPGREATVRVFAALDLDDASVEIVARTAERLRNAHGAPGGSWTAAEKMHVTVKFAGELPVDAVEPLGAALTPLAATLGAPRVYPLRLEAFPRVRHARIVVLELADASGALEGLAAAVDELFAAYGVPKEERPFRPHVTLARLKRPCDARRWLGAPSDAGSSDAGGAGTARVTALTLYRSVLSASGSSYVALARHTLA